jgi:hypothetical protein
VPAFAGLSRAVSCSFRISFLNCGFTLAEKDVWPDERFGLISVDIPAVTGHITVIFLQHMR